MRRLPGLNIQFPIARCILDGTKTIETRTYPLPNHYKGVDLYLIETPGVGGSFRARVIGVIRFSDSFRYSSKTAFYADYSRHLVDGKSPYAWKKKAKWGWVIEDVIPVRNVFEAPIRRGIVFTRSVECASTLQ